MVKNITSLDLLKKNFDNVEIKFINFFEKELPRWPSEKHGFLRNHHQSLNQFTPSNISWEKLKVADLPDNILQELHSAYEAFQVGETYNVQ